MSPGIPSQLWHFEDMSQSTSAPTQATLCVINFNGMSILPATLSAACALAERFAAILLVDNGSEDGSVEMVEQDFKLVRVIRLPENRGAGGARNVGLRESPTDRILFIDNDVTLTPACVDRLMEALDGNPRAALAAATIVYAHRRDTIQYDGAECHFLGTQRLLDEDLPLLAVPPVVRKVGSLSTCCFLADRSRLPPHEEFDEVFFYIFEDHDFGVRVRLLGAEILSLSDAPCYHGKGTEGLSIRQLGTYSSKRIHYVIRNRWLVLLKNYSLRTLLVLAPILLFYDLAQLLLVIKKGWLPEWWRAVVWMCRNLPQVLRERRRIQRLRRVPDRLLLVGGGAPFRAELTTGKAERYARRALDAILGSYWKLAALLI
jgi:GT2 family glycosyltransferase